MLSTVKRLHFSGVHVVDQVTGIDIGINSNRAVVSDFTIGCSLLSLLVDLGVRLVDAPLP